MQDLHWEETCPMFLPEQGLSEGAGCLCTCRGLAVGLSSTELPASGTRVREWQTPRRKAEAVS